MMQQHKRLYTTRLKFYAERLVEIQTFSEPVYNPERWEEVELHAERSKATVKLQASEPSEPSEPSEGGNDAARRRARRQVFDLIGANPQLDLFITLTLDAAKISRSDYPQIVKRLSQWLDNRVRRKGLAYVLVPEYHSDGVNIHFHGVVNSNAVALVDSGVRHDGKVVYNLPEWTLGYTTGKLIDISWDDHVRVTKYISKYMCKGAEKVGGRWYLHGGELAKPRYEYDDCVYSTAVGYESIITPHLSCKTLSLL